MEVPKDDRRGLPTGKLPVGRKIPDGVVRVDRAEVSAEVTVERLAMALENFSKKESENKTSSILENRDSSDECGRLGFFLDSDFPAEDSSSDAEVRKRPFASREGSFFSCSLSFTEEEEEEEEEGTELMGTEVSLE